MTDAALVTADGAVAELIDRAEDRGYLLASELEELREPLGDSFAEVEGLVADRDLPVVDDLASEAEVVDEAPMTVSNDPVRAYMDAAGRYPLLDAEQEQDLAKRYQAGLWAQRMLNDGTRLTPKRRARLHTIRRDGERAKETLIRSNLRLVIAQAKGWAGRDLDFIELIQEGNLGLIRAVEKFDHTKGYKFSTYAVWWIRQALQRGVSSKARAIRVPTSIWELSAKLRRLEAELRQKLGRDPTDEEVATAAGVSVERVQEVGEALRHTSSLDMPVGEDGDATMGDLIADEAAADPSLTVSADDLRRHIAGLLGDLGERERQILELRFGFTDGQPHTLDEIGQIFGMSRERIRQLEKEALARLRHPAAGATLAGLAHVLDTFDEAA